MSRWDKSRKDRDSRKPYKPPRIRTERSFEQNTLACPKVEVVDGCVASQMS